MKVLLSAYACRPYTGSEPGVGFSTMMAVAEQHEVWVLTRTKNVLPIRSYLGGHPLADRIQVHGLDLSARFMRIKKKLGTLGLQWYYDRWQLEAAKQGALLAQSVTFDLVHHITFASDWARAGVAGLGFPFVWGPVGGGVGPPIKMLPTLGLRGLLEEGSRTVARTVMRSRRWYRQAWRAARVVFVQNSETAAQSLDRAKTRLLPNSTALLTELPSEARTRTKEILVVGRLVAWKGGLLALMAIKEVRDREAILHFLGSGPDLARLKRSAAKLGVVDRVRFEGPLPRASVLERVARAGVLLHPAVHDESPVAIGEALSLGTPVVCLDHGGPAELLRRWAASPGIAVGVRTPKRTARDMAAAVDKFLADQPPTAVEAMRPLPEYAESILSAYESAVSLRRELPNDGWTHPGT
jgi:glycosyltransferase involved in cell wall biosynthesis